MVERKKMCWLWKKNVFVVDTLQPQETQNQAGISQVKKNKIEKKLLEEEIIKCKKQREACKKLTKNTKVIGGS